ncbi:MAG: DUF4191 domain-containing protein [Mycobacteriales bacterium]
MSARSGTGKTPPNRKATATGQPKVSRRERMRQFVRAFKLTRERDKRLVPYMLLTFVVVAAVIAAIGYLAGHRYLYLPFAVVIGGLAATITFGRRAQKAAYAQVEGQPGAANMVLQGMRGDWRTTPAVAANASLDTVHRVLGRPGVILIGEGAPHRVRGLLAPEKKRVARIVGDTPIYDIVVGNGAGEVPVAKLSAHLMKLPRNVTSKQITALETRLAALGGASRGAPKGPIPQKAQRQINERMMRRR